MPRINELFTLDYGHSLELNRLEQSTAPGAVNFVGRAARNNGVTARVSPITGLVPAAAGTISVALGGQGGAGVAFLQPSSYYCGRDVMVLTPRNPMTEQEKLWWVMCITANRFRFGFGRQANRTLKDLALPDLIDRPEWADSTNVSKFEGASCPNLTETPPELAPKAWKAFRYDEVFEIKKGYYNKKPPTSTGSECVPFIGATEYNNGVTSHISRENLQKYSKDGSINPDEPIRRKLFPGGCITVSNNGSVGEAFYQPTEFTCTHDVNPLYLKEENVELSPALGLFLATVIRADKYRWGFGRKWRPIRMPASIISLPVTDAGEPDWAYMESYVKTLPYSSQLK
ncbi:restriction endonuclease subunit S [Paraburkholderia kirstenboschensis]|uniref:Restriction endonuclease subunit S n=1 Tax=Paraburkholderia kirstenboschensis TaxID=1245436 RepID=A0ABZ0EJ48_9BURK|nr:restriction endonuclease subunit S [Paraburkholderia kirstenboschensis]WOD16965.1 restriction endonuclease subunit S [Paraburkholderia kirstenboschensis]